jgi:hypothetical protein
MLPIFVTHLYLEINVAFRVPSSTFGSNVNISEGGLLRVCMILHPGEGIRFFMVSLNFVTH